MVLENTIRDKEKPRMVENPRHKSLKIGGLRPPSTAFEVFFSQLHSLLLRFRLTFGSWAGGKAGISEVGSGKSSVSSSRHMWLVNPAAIAGVCC